MFVLKWHPQNLGEIACRQPYQLNAVQGENRLEIFQGAFAFYSWHDQRFRFHALGKTRKCGRVGKPAQMDHAMPVATEPQERPHVLG